MKEGADKAKALLSLKDVAMCNDEFLFVFPLFTYLIEPGPRPGFLKDSSGRVFVPLWTDDDLFERYLEDNGMTGKVSGLRILAMQELTTYLESIPKTIKEVIIDPSTSQKYKGRIMELRVVLKSIKRM